MSKSKKWVLTSETRVIHGITLPWKRVELRGPQKLANGITIGEDRPPKGTVIDSGSVFIALDLLYELNEQDVWDSQFGSAFLLGPHEGLALVAAGLAVQETRGGYHRTEKLTKVIKKLEEQM